MKESKKDTSCISMNGLNDDKGNIFKQFFTNCTEKLKHQNNFRLIKISHYETLKYYYIVKLTPFLSFQRGKDFLNWMH